MIDKYETIIGDLELLDTNRNRDKLVFSYQMSNTFEEYNREIAININLTKFLKNVCLDEDYNFVYIDDNIEFVEYEYTMVRVDNNRIWKATITEDELKEEFIRLGVDEKDVDELLNEIIEQLTYDAIEKLNYLICEDLYYYLRRDEIC